MSPTVDAFLRSWPGEPWLAVALLLSGAVYLRGWLHLHHRDPDLWHGGRLAAFAAALAATYVALASPIEPFAALLLQMHMLQHLLLMMVVPPLVWLAAPLFPLVRGLPEPVRTCWIAPLLRRRKLRAVFAWLTRPLVAWPLFVAATWLWHLPATYQLALGSSTWHHVQHACFLAAGLLFWYPVVRPYPTRPRWSRWLLFPYLVLADVQSTVLAAWLTFSPRVLYAHYEQVPRLAGISALDDQAAAGVLMWVLGSMALLVPLFIVGVALLSPPPARMRRRAVVSRPAGGSVLSVHTIVERPRPAPAAKRWLGIDLVEVSYVGRFLRWRHARTTMQLLMALVAVVVIVDGLSGPQAAPMNLAGVAPWIHWRGLVVLGLLVGGNFFCMVCPFTLPRTLARRWLPGGLAWPRPLRNKWPAVALVALFLWSYEAFALWDSPWLTAWIAIGYFAGALVVDGVFRGGSFCKYVCPIGQFNFVQSLVSPWEVRVRQPAVCASCHTKECIRGTPTIAGCQMQLFQPRKAGNFDCTFCLDCVRACPHENVGVLAAAPGHRLWSDRFRSGVGRFGHRPDVAALVLVLAFGAFANAAGMVGPVVQWQDSLRQWLGGASRTFVVSLYYALALVVIPLVAVGAAGIASRSWGHMHERSLTVATRFAYALVPLGFGMWLAHYSFHFMTSADTIVPATQRFAAGLGWSGLGEPLWQLSCCRPVTENIIRLQVLMLDFGLLVSLYTGFRIAEQQTDRTTLALKAFSPWALLIVAMFVVGVWIVFQPMEMRGTMGLSG